MSAQKEDYLYLSSLLRAREKNMLTRDRAERMLDAPGFEDCAKLLTDSGYEDMSQMNIKQIEDALAARRAALFRELEGLVPDPAALDLFRMKYDYHNIKVLIKSAAMEQEDSALLSESGRIPCETLLLCFRDDRLRDLPGAIGAAAEEA
ncbi:MAG: V-type ATPase subunit, partial [Oscillospiraceae bacterium]|nr:V-type ATPase subunit [Oscillospiraceae bacterium]